MQNWPLPKQLEQAGEAENNGSRTNMFVLLKAHFQRTVSPGYRNQLVLSSIWSFPALDSICLIPSSPPGGVLGNPRDVSNVFETHSIQAGAQCEDAVPTLPATRLPLQAPPMLLFSSGGRTLPSALAILKGEGILPCVMLCGGRCLILQQSCLGSMVLHFGDTALPVLFILLSRAGIRHWDNWARVSSNNRDSVLNPESLLLLILKSFC